MRIENNITKEPHDFKNMGEYEEYTRKCLMEEKEELIKKYDFNDYQLGFYRACKMMNNTVDAIVKRESMRGRDVPILVTETLVELAKELGYNEDGLCAVRRMCDGRRW